MPSSSRPSALHTVHSLTSRVLAGPSGCLPARPSRSDARMVGLVGAMVSFEEGHELLHELGSVEVPPKHVERAAEALGR